MKTKYPYIAYSPECDEFILVIGHQVSEKKHFVSEMIGYSLTNGHMVCYPSLWPKSLGVATMPAVKYAKTNMLSL